MDYIQCHNNEHLDFSMSSILSKESYGTQTQAQEALSQNSDNNEKNRTKNTQGTAVSLEQNKPKIITVAQLKNQSKGRKNSKDKIQAYTYQGNRKKILSRCQS